ncbi:MAG: hypothetical protein FWE35_24190 [Streptosporangiales bacterium]|nr:hypothetical protein [Streptosporangiales bacterium]
MTIASYDPGRGQRRLSWILISCFSFLFGLLGVLSVAEMPGMQGFPILAICVGLLALVLHQYLTRTLYCIELTDADVRWRNLIHRDARPLSQVRSIRYSRMQVSRGVPQQTVTVKFAGRRPLRFVAQEPGMAQFAAAVHASAPHVSIEPPA